MTRGVQCDVRSRLVRRGYPENLDAVLAGNCTVTRMDPMRGPDFTRWLAGASSAITSCDTGFYIPFWTEKSPEGKITKVHFCPEYCEDLRVSLQKQIMQDLVCEDDAGLNAPTVLPPTAGTAANAPGAGGLFPPVGGSAAGAPAAGSGGTIAGAAGALAAGSGGAPNLAGSGASAGLPAAGIAGATAGGAAVAGTGGAAAGTAGIAGAGGSF